MKPSNNTQPLITMAAKIEWQRHKDKTASIVEMLLHDNYLNDPTHIDHAGYTMMPGKNYNCTGDTIEDLVAAVNLAHSNHIRRKEILKVRRRTPQLWGEAIFNLGLFCFITRDERDKIEREFIKRLFPDTAARAYWHVNETTGKSDLHILFAHKRPCGKLTLERIKIGLRKRMQALDRFAADLLNNNLDKPSNRIPDIRTSEDTAEAHAEYYSRIREEKEAAMQAEEDAEKSAMKNTPKKTPPKKKSTALSRKLAAQVARKAEEEGIDDVEAHHLPGLLERLKIKFEIIMGIIKYVSSRKTLKGKTSDGQVRKPRIRVLPIHDFLYDVLHFQVDLRIEREREIAMENSQPITPPTPDLTLVLNKPNKNSADKAALLEMYFNVNLGRIKLDPKKHKSLYAATKGLLRIDGSIEPKFLNSLSDEQKAILKPLAAECAKLVE